MVAAPEKDQDDPGPRLAANRARDEKINALTDAFLADPASTARKFGSHFAAGVLGTLLVAAIPVVLVVLGLNLFRWGFGLAMDDSGASGWNRSGMRVLTDHKTGIQYLEVDGAITPRLDAEGKVMVTHGANR